MELGEEIKRRRKEMGLTLRDLEEITGISASYLSRIEKGLRKNVSISIMFTLAKALNIPQAEVESIFDVEIINGENQAENAENEDINNLINYILNLKKQQKLEIENIIYILNLVKDIIKK